jgi:hypothetical protein
MSLIRILVKTRPSWVEVSWFPSVPPEKCRLLSQIRPWPQPSTCFPIYYAQSSTHLTLYNLTLTALSNKIRTQTRPVVGSDDVRPTTHLQPLSFLTCPLSSVSTQYVPPNLFTQGWKYSTFWLHFLFLKHWKMDKTQKLSSPQTRIELAYNAMKGTEYFVSL